MALKRFVPELTERVIGKGVGRTEEAHWWATLHQALERSRKSAENRCVFVTFRTSSVSSTGPSTGWDNLFRVSAV